MPRLVGQATAECLVALFSSATRRRLQLQSPLALLADVRRCMSVDFTSAESLGNAGQVGCPVVGSGEESEARPGGGNTARDSRRSPRYAKSTTMALKWREGTRSQAPASCTLRLLAGKSETNSLRIPSLEVSPDHPKRRCARLQVPSPIQHATSDSALRPLVFSFLSCPVTGEKGA